MKKIFLFFILIISIGLISGCVLRQAPTTNQEVEIINEQVNNNNDLIIVDYPKSGDEVGNPLIITGQARGNWYFEASFPISVFDSSGEQIGSGVATAQGDWMTTEFVPFTAEIILSAPSGTAGTVVLHKDNPSGLPENDNSITIPVRFSPGVTNLQLFFGNNVQDPQSLNCEVAYPVTRTVAKTDSPAKVALMLLLEGPTEEEKQQGFFTSIKEGTTLQSVLLNETLLTADFNDVLQYEVGGSCLVGAIRAQITQTGLQFPTVEEVKISINGNSEEILQP
jgi:hypothetical protein